MYSTAALPQQLLHPGETLSIDCLVRHTQIEQFTVKYSAPPGKYYTRVSKTTTIYKQFFFFFCILLTAPVCAALCSGWMKILRRSPCNLTFGVIKSKGLPRVFLPATLFFPSRLSIALSHIHALSVSHAATDSILACAGSLGREADGAVLLSSTCLAHITQLISELSKSWSGTKHSCIKQQASWRITIARY